jgi:hypothetical protein
MQAAFRDRFLFVTAARRCGTTYLRELLLHADVVYCCGEIFTLPSESDSDAAPAAPETNFFLYRMKEIRRDISCCRPFADTLQELWVGYLHFLDSLFPPSKRIVLEARYDSLHHLHAHWTARWGLPNVLQLVRVLDIPVLHLVRANHFRALVSESLAEANGRPLFRKKSPPLQTQVVLDPTSLGWSLSVRERELAFFRYYMRGTGIHLEFDYDALCGPEEQFQTQIAGPLAAQLGLHLPTGIRTAYASRGDSLLRTVADSYSRVANVDAVRRQLAGSRFEMLLQTDSWGAAHSLP